MRTVVVTDSFFPRLDGVAVATSLRVQELFETGSLVGVLAISEDRDMAHEAIPQTVDRQILGPLGSWAGYPIGISSTSAVARQIAAWRAEVVEVHTIGVLGVIAMRAARKLRLPPKLC